MKLFVVLLIVLAFYTFITDIWPFHGKPVIAYPGSRDASKGCNWVYVRLRMRFIYYDI